MKLNLRGLVFHWAVIECLHLKDKFVAFKLDFYCETSHEQVSIIIRKMNFFQDFLTKILKIRYLIFDLLKA